MNEFKSPKAVECLVEIMNDLPHIKGRSYAETYNKTGVDLGKYRKNGSLPTVKSFFSFCYSLEIDPAVMVYLAHRCIEQNLDHEQRTFIMNNLREVAIVIDTAVKSFKLCNDLNSRTNDFMDN